MPHVIHSFEPIFDHNSKILILGTFPSVKSREGCFYYHHPQNRFWKIIAYITKTSPHPKTIQEKTSILISNKIAIWDVIKSCDIEGSDDNSIKNVVPMDLSKVLNYSKIQKIFANGNQAYKLYMKYCFNKTNKEIIKLPSTSPANAAYNFNRLLLEWNQINDYL